MDERRQRQKKRPRRDGKPRSVRRKERELALWGLFKLDFDDNESIKSIMSNFGDEQYANQLTETTGDYAQEVLEAFEANSGEVDDWISKYIKEGWRMDKLAKADKAILRLCVTEMLFTKEKVPKEIAINEAIELARKYGEENSTKYINGILNQVALSAAEGKDGEE